MENIGVSSPEEFFSSEILDVAAESSSSSLEECSGSSEISDVNEESSTSSPEESSESGEASLTADEPGSESQTVDLEPITLVLTDTYNEVVSLHESLLVANSLLLALTFFTVAQWVVSKVKGAVERMLNWKI